MTLGLDHPLVCVRDLDAARATYQSLGFAMKPPGMHPWGTSTALVIFRRQLLELVGIGDASLLDGYPAGNFRFGRHVQTHLAQREGVPLTALCSEDTDRDAAALIARGAHCEGRIDFGRDVVRADGTPDRTATTLQIFTRPGLERLGILACQQHRRDLIEFPEWMDHPNGAMGFASATILAARRDQPGVRDWLAVLHGADAVYDTDRGFAVDTGSGLWRVTDRAGAAALFGPVPEGLAPDGAPSVVSLDIKTRDMALLKSYLATGDFTHHQIGDTLVLTEVDRLGGILLTFCRAH
ncbi:VOC family protein [Roseovarius sp. M141]|uniref:VOC family protein n=1 Tax=Roseovarius sp. M141 TaxID=2583806 RepID=UPI0020CD200A|nr:VOC family protein [Roseovarius sp. M141]MCQ0091606.1 VOC family protein [Roseovarius sp. M141]